MTDNKGLKVQKLKQAMDLSRLIEDGELTIEEAKAILNGNNVYWIFK